MENFHSNKFMQVTDVTLMVTDIETSLKFYQESFGFKLLEKSDNE